MTYLKGHFDGPAGVGSDGEAGLPEGRIVVGTPGVHVSIVRLLEETEVADVGAVVGNDPGEIGDVVGRHRAVAGAVVLDAVLQLLVEEEVGEDVVDGDGIFVEGGVDGHDGLVRRTVDDDVEQLVQGRAVDRLDSVWEPLSSRGQGAEERGERGKHPVSCYCVSPNACGIPERQSPCMIEEHLDKVRNKERGRERRKRLRWNHKHFDWSYHKA